MHKYDFSVWHGAKFVYTDFPLYYSPDLSPWTDNPRKTPYKQHMDIEPGAGLPMFACDFISAQPTKASIAVSALGVVDIWLNGKRIGAKDMLKPGFASFDKRTFYHEYDISDLLVDGTNRVLAVVSGGWYCGRISGCIYGGDKPAVMVCVNVSDKNGESHTVTNEGWKANVGGRVVFADIWDGEFYDARLDSYEEISSSDYDISSWSNAQLCDFFGGEVSPFVGATVQIRENLTLFPKKINVYSEIIDNSTEYGEIKVDFSPEDCPFELKKGQKAVVDFGQNAVGRAAIKIKAEKGTKIKIRYAEMLNDSGKIDRGNDGAKGSVYTINMRSAKAKAYYVANGSDEECYGSTFAFFGFRYAEISADADFELTDCRFEIIGSANEETGKIVTSNELLNKLISNIIWGQRSNYLFVPTDCPQRDERLGWTGDTQVFCRTAAYNADIRGFMHKWLGDMRDAQSAEGAYSDVVPRVKCCASENASAWGDAGIIVPYTMYMMYGDKSFIEEHYSSMEKYIAQLLKKNGYKGAEPRYGDWLAYDLCKNEFISCAYFIQDLDMLAVMSDAVAKPDRAEYYRELSANARNYFKENFTENGVLKGKTQADFCISLNLGLLSEEYAKKAAEQLAKLVKENGNRLSTGFLGTYHLCQALSKMGEDNLAYTLLLQRDEPSWLYSVDQGATTIWERWNSYTLKNGFGDVGMNSFNHYAYGAIEEWMYRYMAGIEALAPGFERVLLNPRIDMRAPEDIPQGQEKITWVKASYNSVNGTIESAWNSETGFSYECSVPVASTLLLPLFGDKITVNGVEHSVKDFTVKDGKAVIELAPGKYVFMQ